MPIIDLPDASFTGPADVYEQLPVPGGYDDFNRPDGPLVRTSDHRDYAILPASGGTVTPRIVAGGLRASVGTGSTIAAWDTEVTAARVRAVVRTAGDRAAGIAFRVADLDDYLLLAFRTSTSDGRFRLRRSLAGTLTDIGTQVAPTAVSCADGDIVDLLYTGTTITVDVNGVNILSASTGAHLASTGVGAQLVAGSSCVIESITVIPAE